MVYNMEMIKGAETKVLVCGRTGCGYLEPRRWVFPDNKTRTLYLTRDHWRNFAYLQRIDGWSEEEYAELIYQMALEFEGLMRGLEAQIQICSALLVNAGFISNMNPANDNCKISLMR